MLAAGDSPIAGKLAAALACFGLLAAARADAQASRAPAGDYAFEAFRAGPGSHLPDELRAPGLSPALTYGTHAVEFSWVGREHFDLRGYRLTATVEGGPLSGLAARWTIAPGSGRALGAGGRRAYRVHLPIPADGRLHVRAVLEALGSGGAPVPLAEHDAVPQPDPNPQGLSAGAARVLPGTARDGAWVNSRVAPSLAVAGGMLAAPPRLVVHTARGRRPGTSVDLATHPARGPPTAARARRPTSRS